MRRFGSHTSSAAGLSALPFRELYAPIVEDMLAVERVFDEEIRTDVLAINDLCDTVRSYRGKMLRPALLLLVGRACGRIEASHHTLGAVIEMVHMATLVHDDVLDDADERRRQPTIRALSGNEAAILLGDYFISHAFHLCSELDSQHATRRIGAATNAVCEGELLQNLHRQDADLSDEAYFDIIGRKTAALTATACELGAYCSGANASLVRAMRMFGHAVGVAFQIVDDVLDIVGERQEVGKTLGLDLNAGKLTLATLHGLKHADAATRSFIRAAITGESPCSSEQLRERLSATDSVAYALSAASERVSEALHQLDRLPPSESRSSLKALAEFIVLRQC